MEKIWNRSIGNKEHVVGICSLFYYGICNDLFCIVSVATVEKSAGKGSLIILKIHDRIVLLKIRKL